MSWTGLKAVGARLLLAWLLVLTAAPAPARDTHYTATVPVADRSEAARDQAVRQALGEVLMRLSGDRAVLQQAGSATLLARANRYLQQYQYEEAGAGALVLRAGFDGTALEAAMQRQGLALWGRERPPVLVWLAVDDGSRRYLLGSDAADSVQGELLAAAGRQGLELILPLYDLQEQAQLSVDDVWGGELARVGPASQRYPSQVVLIGRLQRAGTLWNSRWSLRSANADARWQTSAAELGAVLDQGLGQAAERLTVQRPQPDPAEPGSSRLTLRVEGVAGLADYARVSQYLNGLGPVRGIQLVAVQAQRLEYQVDVQGSSAGLEQSLALGGVLERTAAVDAPAGALAYRLRP